MPATSKKDEEKVNILRNKCDALRCFIFGFIFSFVFLGTSFPPVLVRVPMYGMIACATMLMTLYGGFKFVKRVQYYSGDDEFEYAGVPTTSTGSSVSSGIALLWLHVHIIIEKRQAPRWWNGGFSQIDNL